MRQAVRIAPDRKVPYEKIWRSAKCVQDSAAAIKNSYGSVGRKLRDLAFRAGRSGAEVEPD
jgi:hypothetical protein